MSRGGALWSGGPDVDGHVVAGLFVLLLGWPVLLVFVCISLWRLHGGVGMRRDAVSRHRSSRTVR